MKIGNDKIMELGIMEKDKIVIAIGDMEIIKQVEMSHNTNKISYNCNIKQIRI